MTGSPWPHLTICVLNLRMGGQVTSLTSLASRLRARGMQVEFALPEGVGSPGKADLDAFVHWPLWRRFRSIWRMLRTLPAQEDRFVHLVLPTPAFSFLALLIPTRRSRVLVQSEGLPTSFDAEHRKDLRDDPAFMLPRLILNHGFWVVWARRFRLAHLVTAPPYAAWLRQHGFEDVTSIGNFAEPDLEPESPQPLHPFGESATVLAFIGHAHRVKGLEDLIEAFAQAQPGRPDLALVIALSSDGDANRIQARVLAMEEPARSRVFLTGLVPVQRMLRVVDALVLPYRSLTSTTLYPSLILEADQAHCPLVVSRLPYLETLLPAEGPGLDWVPPRDPAALARVIRHLPRRRNRPMSSSLLDLPDADARVDLLIQTYQRLCRRPF